MSVKFKNPENELPKPESLEGHGAKYYLVQPKGYFPCKAMYLKDESGHCDWYVDYTAKIIRPIVGWTEI